MGKRLTQIATRTGDNGTTGLGDNTRVSKDSLRVHAMGDVDELNSQIGVLLCEEMAPDVGQLLVEIQHQLFNLGGELSIPGFELLKTEALLALDQALEHYNSQLPKLQEFILPAGNRAAAQAHVCRTVARRAERAVVALGAAEAVKETPRPGAQPDERRRRRLLEERAARPQRRPRRRLASARRQDGQRQARDAGQLAGIVGHVDLPDLGGAADVDWPRDARHPARGRALDVVGVDVQPHRPMAFGTGVSGAAGAQGFGQHHRDAAVQQAVRLFGAMVDRDAGAQEIVADLEELHPQVFRGGVLVDGVQFLDRDRLFPDAHGFSLQRNSRGRGSAWWTVGRG
jgi:cob(I)alamin adenosyltransferase